MDRQLKIYLLVLLTGFSCLAITPYLPFFGSNAPEFNPNSLSAFGWWEPSRGYVTNADGFAILPNLSSFGTNWDLTSLSTTANTFPVRQVARLNGQDTIGFHGVSAMFNSIYGWVPVRTQEVFFVASMTNASTSRSILVAWSLTNMYQWLQIFSPPRYQMKVGSASALAVSEQQTNKYVIFDLVFKITGTTIYTNGIQGLSINQTATNASGIGLAVFSTFTNGVFSFASMCTFTQELTAAERLNLINYYTNRFGAMP